MRLEQGIPRRAIWAIATIALMLALVVTPRSAGAAVGGCRVDPIVVLSNGLTIQVDVAIDTGAANVSSVDYIIHGPANTHVVSLTYAGATTIPEHVSYIADGNDRSIVIETTVNANDRVDISIMAQAGNDSVTDQGRTNHRERTRLRP